MLRRPLLIRTLEVCYLSGKTEWMNRQAVLYANSVWLDEVCAAQRGRSKRPVTSLRATPVAVSNRTCAARSYGSARVERSCQ